MYPLRRLPGSSNCSGPLIQGSGNCLRQTRSNSETWTYKKLEAMVRQGKAEKRKFRVEAVTQVRPVTHYRMIDDEG